MDFKKNLENPVSLSKDEIIAISEELGISLTVVERELDSIELSVRHNIGPYFDDFEVELIASQLFQQIFQNIQTHFKKSSHDVSLSSDDQFEKFIQSQASLDLNNFLSIQRGNSRVLQVVRQDNKDKWGAGKYRSREIDKSELGATWVDKPSYWSEKLRSALQSISTHISISFPKSKILFISEGGIYKGTATSGTDIDTEVYIYGINSKELGEIYKELERVFYQEISKLGFNIKSGEKLRYRFYSLENGQVLSMNDDQEFEPAKFSFTKFGNPPEVRIRKKEKGLYVLSGDQTKLHSKSISSEGDEFLVISLATGDVVSRSETATQEFEDDPEVTDFLNSVW